MRTSSSNVWGFLFSLKYLHTASLTRKSGVLVLGSIISIVFGGSASCICVYLNAVVGKNAKQFSLRIYITRTGHRLHYRMDWLITVYLHEFQEEYCCWTGRHRHWKRVVVDVVGSLSLLKFDFSDYIYLISDSIPTIIMLWKKFSLPS